MNDRARRSRRARLPPWLRDNDPDAACMKREAAIVAARLDEVLAEKITIREYEPASLSISPLEVLLLATFTEQTRAATSRKRVQDVVEQSHPARPLPYRLSDRVRIGCARGLAIGAAMNPTPRIDRACTWLLVACAIVFLLLILN